MKNRNIIIGIVSLLALLGLQGCKWYVTDPVAPRLEFVTPIDTALNNYILEKFTEPYNINVVYTRDKYISSVSGSVETPTLQKTNEVLKFVDTVFLNSLREYIPDTVLRQWLPKEIYMYGGRHLNSDGTELPPTSDMTDVLSIYNVNTFSYSDNSSVQRMALEIYTSYGLYILSKAQKNIQEFANYNYSPYNRWDLSGDESKKTYNNKREILLEFGYFSDAAQLQPTQDFAETLAALITVNPRILRTEINNVTVIPEYTYFGNELIEKTNAANAAKKTITAKVDFVNKYMRSLFNVDIKKLNQSVVSNINKMMSQNADSSVNNEDE